MPVIGFLGIRVGKSRLTHFSSPVFREGLSEKTGYVEGQEHCDRVSLGGGPVRSRGRRLPPISSAVGSRWIVTVGGETSAGCRQGRDCGDFDRVQSSAVIRSSPT